MAARQGMTEGTRANRGIDTGHPLSYADIEHRAMAFRNLTSLNGGPLPVDARFPAVRAFERLRTLQRQDPSLFHVAVPLDYAVQDAPHSSVMAWTTYEDGKFVITVTTETYAGLESGDPTALFSFGHEIGHVDLHPDILMKFAKLPHLQGALRRGAPPHPSFRDSEWQANAFSAALLMPAAGLAILERQGRLTIDDVRRVYGVSFKAADYRINTYRGRRAALLGG